MINSLSRFGVTCELAASDDDGPAKRLPQDAPERQLGHHLFIKERDFYTYAPSFSTWLRKHILEFDIVHVHGLFSYVSAIAPRIARNQGVPYIITPHGHANRFGMRSKPWRKWLSYALLERGNLKQAAAVHMTSRAELSDFELLGIEVATLQVPLKVEPITGGDATAIGRRWPMLQGKQLAVFLGRLDPVKNLENLIAAFRYLAAEAPNLQLVIAGSAVDARYEETLRQRASTEGVEVFWTGHVSGQEKADLLAGASCLLLPSLSESFAMAAVEGLTAGLPCVLGQDVAVAEDIVQAGFGVDVVPTSAEIAKGILSALKLGASPLFAERAKEFAERTYSSEEIVKPLVDLYWKIASRGTVHDSKRRHHNQIP